MHSSTIKRLIRHSIIVFIITLPSLTFAENKPFSVAYNESWPPFSFRNENNEMAGILVDIVKEVFDTKLKKPVEFYGYPWKRVQHNVEIGIHDAFVTTATDTRLAYSNRSNEAVYILEEKAFINRHSEHKKALSSLTLNTIRELENYNVCDMIGNGWADNFYGKYDIEIKRFKDINLCFRNIAFKRYDIAIHVSAAGLTLLKKEQLADKVEMLPVVFDEVPFPLLVSKKSKHLDILPKFDQAIRAFKQEGGIQKIVDRYTR